MRAGTLQAHARQLDSAVNLKEHPGRLHPDHDRDAPGVRVMVGPETRSLLRQLRDSRDIRVQQQLVREVIHQLTKRVLTAMKHSERLRKIREGAVKAAKRVRAAGQRTRAAGQRAWSWSRWAGAWVRSTVADRRSRSTGTRHLTRVRGGGFGTVPARGRPAASGRFTRTPAARTRSKRVKRA
jgi:hypothetical protein